MNEPLPALQTNTTDYVASLSRGTFGAIPFVGPIAAEIIGHVIPTRVSSGSSASYNCWKNELAETAPEETEEAEA